MSCWLHASTYVFQASIAIFTVCAISRSMIDDLFLRQIFTTFRVTINLDWVVMINRWIIVSNSHRATTTTTPAVCATYFARAGFRPVCRMCCQLVSTRHRIGYYLSQHESLSDWDPAQPLHFWLSRPTLLSLVHLTLSCVHFVQSGE